MIPQNHQLKMPKNPQSHLDDLANRFAATATSRRTRSPLPEIEDTPTQTRQPLSERRARLVLGACLLLLVGAGVIVTLLSLKS